ncbi:MAG: hypothetical protein ABS45_05720 [Comamonas sp. SCN 65-56]|uniref:FimV/HubP family polar landmark protein n=1 Tax=Comamonas sp. SCN 65-56 TaxID=1660095 RepID=UPI00086F3065|nr:FimV/HubP family polar landmark protein [Comamonas sp. SCN 65-56]ODS92695.1 MAG: hypothetical protein ABS45_05720 [Comamonas sp. SCN 65-56]
MHRCKPTLLAVAAALSMGLYASNASALALGRVTVQSALGEPLRAEIALPQVSAAEADSLNVTIASPEVFRAQGLEYSAAIKGIRVDLKREANGKMVLRLSSNQTITDPFIDLVVDAAWNAGHIVRSYTMLFDPPGLRSAPAPIAAQVDTSPRSSASPAPVRTPQVAAAPAPAPVSAPAAARKAEASPGEVKVRSGDTASAIASAHRPSGISLDQMLVALVRANPKAFIDGNVNRLRAGSVLQMPDQASAEATSAAEASKIVAAQSRDFNAFRHRLAGAAPAAGVEAASRTSSGKVQTQVSESKPEAASADKLTLSKGSAAGDKADAETAQTKQADQTSARMAELSKNISELKALSDGATDAKAAPTAPATPPAPGDTAKPGVEAATPAAPAADAAAAPPPEESAAPAAPAAAEPPAPVPAPEPAPAPAATAAAEAPPKPAAAAPAPEPQEEPGLLASLTENPMAAGGALALVLLLLGWGGYRWQQGRRRAESPETTFASEGDHPDSFFAESGGQEVDTTSSDLTTGSTSTLYSPSQLDQTGDVDPIAEADVYLAYGKDPQAEEILKEALIHHPEKVAIPAKLAEIYAKRQDRAALEGAARQVHALTDGAGPDWERVQELGRGIDADNPLYQAGTPLPDVPASIPPAVVPAAAAAALPEIPAVPTAEATQTAAADSVLPSIDLDLDLASPTHTAADAAHAASANAFTAAAVSAAQLALEIPAEPDSGIGGLTLPAALEETTPPAAHPPETMGEPLEFPTEGLALADSGPMPLSPKEIAPTEPAPLEFDLGGLSLDLDKPSAAASAPVATDLPSLPELPSEAAADSPLPEDPLSTKLALAEEFKTIGDSEGARALIEEVLAEASGETKIKAERLLKTLG